MKRRQFLNQLALGLPVLAITRPLGADFAPIPLTPSGNRSMQWLKRYNSRSTQAVIDDPRLRQALSDYFDSIRAPFWAGKSVPVLVRELLSLPGSVSVQHNRFLHITGRLAHFAEDRGMLWIDTHYPSNDERALAALAVVMSHPNRQNQFWLAINRESTDVLRQGLPHNLTLGVRRWVRLQKVRFTGLNVLDSKGRVTPEIFPEHIGVPSYRLVAA